MPCCAEPRRRAAHAAGYFPAGQPTGTSSAQLELYENKLGQTLLGQEGRVQYVGHSLGEDYSWDEQQPCKCVPHAMHTCLKALSTQR